MKKIGYIICLLFGAMSLSAQPKLYSVTSWNDFNPKRKVETVYSYNSNGQLETTEERLYMRLDSSPRLANRQVLRYDAQNRLLSEERLSNSYVKNKNLNFRDRTFTENTYNGNGCLVRSQWTVFIDGILTGQQTTENTVNERCKTTQQRLTERYLQTDRNPMVFEERTPIIKTFSYDSNDSLIRIDYQVGSNTVGFHQFTRRTDGRIIEEYVYNAICFGYIDFDQYKDRFYYNSDGQLAGKVHLWTLNPLQNPNWFYSDSTVYTYKDNRITTSKQFWEYNSLTNTYLYSDVYETRYDLYCDGLVKKITTGSSRQKEFSYQLYKYIDSDNCPTFPDTKTFKIYPNPAIWLATIETDALFTANFKVSIFNTVGQEVASYDVDYRTPTFDFSTVNLIKGTYMVRLWNGEKVLSQKLMVSH
jgi:hypothetical protein